MPFRDRYLGVLGLGAALLLSGCATLPVWVPGKDSLSSDEHVKLGVSYEAQGDLAHAGEQYQLALKRDKHNTQALLNLGQLAFNAGDYNHATAYYARALKLLPHDPTTSNNLAMVYIASGKHQDRIKSLLDDALKQEGPLRPYALETKAEWEKKQGHIVTAVDLYKQAEAAVPAANTVLRDTIAAERRRAENQLQPRKEPKV